MYSPQSRMRTQVVWTRVVGFIYIDYVPVISPYCHGEKDKTEQTYKPRRYYHHSVPHCTRRVGHKH